ncbi:MAG: Ig-like domain-containing protein, partial [Anaerococcus vaginalis]|uniref:Ig-like domain-containing protein n=1 Tax=Anaerococcus vaginalis TaxID=33037 RepID=UPI002901C69C
WSVDTPELKENDVVKAVATEDGKKPSDETTATIGKADEEKSEAPTINPVKVGDTKISGTAKPNAIVNVTYPNGDVTETTADEQGNWSVDAPDGLAEGQTITAISTEGGKTPSDAAETKVKGKGTKVGGDVKPVKPTDDKQDTGIKVENPNKDTKVTAKDEDGKDVPVEIDENGNVIVTPGKNVDGPITVTIEDPDLPGGKVEIEVPVEGHEKGKDDNNSDKDGNKTIADKTNPTVPSKTEVKDKNNLTDEEKDKVKKAIEDANKDKFPQGTKVEIGKDGTATITYPDGSVDIIKGKDLVSQKANAGASGSINRVNSSNTGKNVKTGVGSSATILATLAAAVSGLFASKKRKND